MLQLSIIIFRNTEERILLQFRDSGAPTAPLMWSFFGGVADSADETPEQAIVREVQEELHMDIAEEDLIKHAEMPWNETQEKIVHFFEYRHPIT
ncbi:MAG: NUDIX domain-containing protein, partial [Candidatus Peribacteraceae bacterium]|nr:NUDIX domain-containing protein [Candidatus Peribacteraceae bacterium]